MELKEAKEIVRAGLAWANWTDEQKEAMKTMLEGVALLEQVKGAYDDRLDDLVHYEKVMAEIKDAHENKDAKGLNEFLHDLFTKQLAEDY